MFPHTFSLCYTADSVSKVTPTCPLFFLRAPQTVDEHATQNTHRLQKGRRALSTTQARRFISNSEPTNCSPIAARKKGH